MYHHRAFSDSKLIDEGLRASIVNASMCEMDFPHAEETVAITLDTVRVDTLAVSRCLSTGPQSVRRGNNHIRMDGLDTFIVTLPLSADFHFFQRGNECTISPGDFALIATARPFTVEEQSKSHSLAMASLHVVVPGPLLRERCPRADEICSRALPIRPGAGQMMRSLMFAWLQDGASLSATQSRSASELLVDLIASATAQGSQEGKLGLDLVEQTREQRLNIATGFIAANLSDPRLNTARVARRCNVSVRYLQKLFETESISVAGYIREKRLHRCRESLIGPDLRHWTVGQIAALWGFNEPSQFSRAYKHRFGITPTEERKSG